MKAFWATLLIIVGVLFLAGNFNLIQNLDLARLLMFWPLALVLLGIGILTKNNRNRAGIMAAALVLSALFVWYVAYAENPVFKLNEPSRTQESANDERESKISADVPEGAKEARIEINTGAVDFKIDEGTDKILEGTLISSFLEPVLETDKEGDVATASLETKSFRRRFFFRDFTNEMNLKLNQELPLDFEVNTGASELDFDLTALKIKNFLLKAGASDIKVRFGDKIEDGTELQWDSGASNIEISVPENIGVKIVSESGLTAQNYDGFEKKGDDYFSKGYDRASKKILISLRAGASSVTVNRD